NDFRKAECGPGASATFAAKPAKAKNGGAASGAADAEKGVSMADCSAKYQAAKDADALDGMKWNDFRKAECGPGASATFAAKPAKAAKKAADSEAADAEKGLSLADCSAKYQAAKDADALDGMKWNDFRKTECGPGASATFAAKPAKATKKARGTAEADAGKGLTMAECSARYQAAKAGNALNGMKWNDFRKAQCGSNAS